MIGHLDHASVMCDRFFPVMMSIKDMFSTRVPLPSPISIFLRLPLISYGGMRCKWHCVLTNLSNFLLHFISQGIRFKLECWSEMTETKLNSNIFFQIFMTHLPFCLVLDPHPPSHELSQLSQHECHCCCVTQFIKCVNCERTARLQLLGTFLPFFAYL